MAKLPILLSAGHLDRISDALNDVPYIVGFEDHSPVAPRSPVAREFHPGHQFEFVHPGWPDGLPSPSLSR